MPAAAAVKHEQWTEAHVLNFTRRYFAQRAKQCGTRIYLGKRWANNVIEILDPVALEKKHTYDCGLLIPWGYLKRVSEIASLMDRDLRSDPFLVLFVDPFDIRVVFITPLDFKLYVGCTWSRHFIGLAQPAFSSLWASSSSPLKVPAASRSSAGPSA